MQQNLIVGDTLSFTTTLADYPASAGWSLTYRLVPRTSGSAIEIAASASGDDHVVSVSATTTALWTAGEYSWAAYVTKDAERHTIEGWTSTDGRYGGGSTILLRPDPAIATSYDSRSSARKTLEAIEAVIENRATRDQQEYSIAGRSLKRTPITDLLTLRSTYKNEVAREEAAGNPHGRRYYLRMGRA